MKIRVSYKPLKNQRISIVHSFLKTVFALSFFAQKCVTFTKPFSCVKVERFAERVILGTAESTTFTNKDFANTVLEMNGV